jgi:tetratricopeptide (TPR) repeat protein
LNDAWFALWLRSALFPTSEQPLPGQEFEESEGPEDLLLRMLVHTDEESDPAASGAVHAAYARLLESTARPDAALNHYRRARELAATAATSAPQTRQLGDGILQLGLESATFAEARLQLVQAYLAHGLASEADREAQKLLEELVGLSPAHIAAAYRVAAQARRELGKPAAALRLLRFARWRLERTSDPAGTDEHMLVLGEAAEAYLSLHKFQEANAALQDAWRILQSSTGASKPADAEAARPEISSTLRCMLGDMASASGDVDEARAHYRRALELEGAVRPARPRSAGRIKERIDLLPLTGALHPSFAQEESACECQDTGFSGTCCKRR